MQLKGKKVAVLAAPLYEDNELWYPYYRLKEEGAEVTLVGTGSSPDQLESKHGQPVKIDKRAGEVGEDDFDGLIVPGGYGPDHLRRCNKTIELVKKINEQKKPVGAICHAGWVLISADAVKGKKGTSFYSIKDDMVNAGFEWVDEEVVVDGNLVTSRYPPDLPAFMRAYIDLLK